MLETRADSGHTTASRRSHTSSAVGGVLTAAVLMVPAATVLALFAGVRDRGTWMDEFWSLFLSDPSLSPLQLVRARLLHDVHPPLYSLLATVARRVDDAGTYSGRLLNCALVLLALGYTGVALRRARAADKAPHLLVFLFSTSYFLLHHLPEFRAYSLLTVASGCYALSAWFVLGAENGPARADTVHRATLEITAFTLANSHYYGALLVSLHLTLSMAVLSRAGRRSSARRLLSPLLVSVVPAILWFGLTYPHIEHLSGGRFWLPELQVLGTTKTLVGVLLKVCSNLVAWGLAGLGAILLLAPTRTGLRRVSALSPSLLAGPALAVLSFALTGAGLVLTTLVISLHTPILMDRYLSVLTGPLCAIVAVLVLHALRAVPRPWQIGLTSALFANGVLFCAWLVYAQGRHPDLRQWEHTARVIGALQTECRERPVQYAFMHARTVRPHSRDEMLAMGAQKMAAQFGFTAARAPLPSGAVVTASRRCPVALWLLNVPEHEPLSAAQLLSRGHYAHPTISDERLSIDHRGVTAVLYLSEKAQAAPRAHARR